MAEPEPALPEPAPFGPGSPRTVDELEREIWLGGEAGDSGLDLGWEGAAAVAEVQRASATLGARVDFDLS